MTREYPVSPATVATVLSANVSFSTGLIQQNTLAIMTDGAKRTIIEYRPPQRTALWLEGSEDPIKIPLPGLLMVRTTYADRSPEYRIHAVKERPTELNAQLYRAPLPNISYDGSVCWGTVTKVNHRALAGTDLHEDWAQLLGTPFGNHSVSGKTKTLSDDIRKFYLALEKRKARVFPKREMISNSKTLGQLIDGKPTNTPIWNDPVVPDDDFAEGEFEDDEFDDEIGGPLGIARERQQEDL